MVLGVKQLFSFLNRGIVYWVPLAILCFAAGLRLEIPDFIERLSLIAFDSYQRQSPREASDTPIRIVDIDDTSLKEIGQWPWPRSVVADLLEKLREAGAAVVVFDILFSAAASMSPDRVCRRSGRVIAPRTRFTSVSGAMTDP